MAQTPQNPYRAPETNPPLKSKGCATLANIKSSEIKKLRNNSHTIRAMGFLACLSLIISIVIYFKTSPDYYLSRFDFMIELRIVLLIIAAASLIAAITFFARKKWTKPVGIIFCSLMILHLGLISVIIGILGIIALCNSQRLLGPNRLHHTEIDKEYKIRKKEGRI